MLRRNLRVGFKPKGFYIVCVSVLHTCVSELHTCLHTRVSTQHLIFRQMEKTGDRRNITRAGSTRNMPFYYSKNMPFTTAIVLWRLVHSQQHLAAQQELTARLCASCVSMLVKSTLACCELPSCWHCQHAGSMLVMLVCQHAGHVSSTTIFWL